MSNRDAKRHTVPAREVPDSELSDETLRFIGSQYKQVFASGRALQAALDRGLKPGVAGDPLAETLELMPLSTSGQKLVKFLARWIGKAVRIRDISKHIYGSIDKATIHKTHVLIGRNADHLDDSNAPLRIERSRQAQTATIVKR